MRNNSIKYVIYKDQIINYEGILDIKKALSISDDELVIEIEISSYNNTIIPLHMINKPRLKSGKFNLVYIFYNLKYEEIKRTYLSLF